MECHVGLGGRRKFYFGFVKSLCRLMGRLEALFCNFFYRYTVSRIGRKIPGSQKRLTTKNGFGDSGFVNFRLKVYQAPSD